MSSTPCSRSPRVAEPPFSAVVVSHESADELAELLDSVDRHLDPRPEVIVVDTGSADATLEVAEGRADVVALGENPGFGAASNAGVERATAEVTVLLNPDVELLDDGLVRLAGIARARRVLAAPQAAQPRPHRPAQRAPASRPRTGAAPRAGAPAGAAAPPSSRGRPLARRAAAASGLGGGRLHRCPHRAAAIARPLRSGAVPLLRGHGPVPARAPPPGCPPSCTRRSPWCTQAGTPRLRHTAASRTSCSPAGAARWWPRALGGGRRLSMISPRGRRSPLARGRAGFWGATAHASAPSSPDFWQAAGGGPRLPHSGDARTRHWTPAHRTGS